ncbi:hypothetical protein CKN80_12940 [Carnobacterium divergens]|uniref:hypothetical protein n=1 Tax=Carnobacterium divergens TaxID=2748 RepID=UPI001072C52C|nr:hypothetical protein [Carnobacterium divergens]TFJ43450.1 hypothetical protein CKN79_12935 [Carnobacterium divergens]TFJ50602.1 hypothetical protein CKN80_12940 [Carnobacterium divergens]
MEEIKLNLSELNDHREELKKVYYDVQTSLDSLNKTFTKLDDYMKGKSQENLNNFVTVVQKDVIEPAYEYNIKTIAMLNATVETFKEEALQTL